MLKRLSAVIVALLVTAGCATTSIDKDFSLSQHPHDGVIVVSVSHDLDDVLGGSFAIFYWSGGPSGAKQGQIRSRQESLPGIYKRSEFEDVYGHLYAFNIPAGVYQFTSWQIRGGSAYVEPRRNPSPLSFSVKAGEVKYIGNLHGYLAFGKNLLGLPAFAGGYPEVKDAGARDLALLKERFPNLADKVVVALLPLGPWVPSAGQ